MQEYVTLRKNVLGLPEIHFSDLFVPLVPGVDRTYTYEEAQQIVLDATAVLGEDYTAVLKEAFDNRWIDVYPAKNKATGRLRYPFLRLSPVLTAELYRHPERCVHHRP